MQQQTKTYSILSLIFGILGIVLTFTPAAIVGLILAILGIVFSSIAKKKEGKNGFATGGFVLSLIALILWVIVVVIVGLVLGAGFLALAALS
ncbi:hypothetical protein AGMMS49983_14400 [Clostridia bacterium]|nr:hypothetical protein AGMMS49983_14400 [Clostridia bacterium]